jgi:toxin ParE1/3/4
MALVSWTDQALDDLEAISLFIARSVPAASSVFVHRVLEAAAQLATFPRSGRIVPEVRDPDIREVVLDNYRLIYRVTARDNVEVLTIHHGARRLDQMGLT